MQIRPESDNETDAIRALSAAAFASAAVSDGSEPGIVDGLRADGDLWLSLVALEDDAGGPGAIVGHVALSPVRLGAPGRWFGLGPISVAPDRQRRGIGSALVRAALDRLRDADAAGCVLVGDPDYYGRFGFAPAPGLAYGGLESRYVLGLGFGADRPSGEVVYPRAFAGASA